MIKHPCSIHVIKVVKSARLAVELTEMTPMSYPNRKPYKQLPLFCVEESAQTQCMTKFGHTHNSSLLEHPGSTHLLLMDVMSIAPQLSSERRDTPNAMKVARRMALRFVGMAIVVHDNLKGVYGL